MSTLTIDVAPEALERRLAQGAEILFDMECQGDTGTEYHQWLNRWIQLLAQYEALDIGALQAA